MSRKDDDPWVRVFDVTEPRKHKKGYTIYKVISKVFPKNSVEAVTQVTVWKRYNDFKKLHKALSTIHQNLHLKGTFPKFAEARFFGRFASDVIEERRKSALQLLEFAAQHSSLFTSQVFVKFFEDGQYIHPSENDELIQNKLLSPVKIHPDSHSQKSCINTIEEKKITETSSLLGGIWEHCQTADDISLSSHPSDDDDRTTFTDEDSRLGTPLPSNDLALFDPLVEKNTDHLNSLEGESNSWLLSALQSCTYVHPDDQASSSPTLSFPKPFAELDYAEDSEHVEHILEDSSSQAIPDIQEFDPLLDSSTNIKSKEDLSPKLELPSPLNAPENTYLFEAANLISQAHDFEAAGDFVSSFSYYRAAIGILLQGVQGDTNAAQREAVRRKTAQYLSRAEEIYGKYVVGHLKDENRWANDSRLSVTSTIELNIGCLRGSYNELANYKVLGILGHVLLVLDSITNSTFVVKSLYKRPDAKSFNSPNIVPQEIPFMVQLHKVYETDYAIFLVLQHASGGRLWDYVNSYLQHSPMSPCIDCGVPLTDYIMENKSNQRSCKNNVYTGKKLENLSENTNVKEAKDSVSVSSHISIDSDLETASTYPANYTALFAKHVASVDPDKRVFSKCHINFQKDDGVQCAEESPNVLDQSPTNKNEGTSVMLTKTIDKNNSSEIILNSKISESSPKNVTYLQGEKDSNLPDLVNDHMPYSSNDGIELLISNSKTLLYNVDETLKATSPTSKNINNANNLITQDDILHYKNIISENNKDHQNNTVVNEEKYNLENKDNRKYKTQLKYSDNLLLTHQIEGLSSSVGSLTSQRIRHLSEVFQQLSTAASNQPYLPESCVRIWIAELIIALSYLHNLGLSWKDLRPDNILLGERGHILLTYHSSWNCMDQVINRHAKENLYSAPEVGGIFPITFACDWWSVGALMFELLTGRTLISCHPGGITAHSNINIPAHISMEARDLIVKLLKYNVSERLGSGPHGVEDIKSHPFFLGYNWNKIYN